jgi:hypothetical protein
VNRIEGVEKVTGRATYAFEYPGQFTLDATMPPSWVLPGHRNDQPGDRHRGRWPQ